MPTPGRAPLGSLLEEAPIAMLGVDQAGVILFVNKLTEQMFGYERDELVGEPVESLMPESFRADHSRARASHFAHPVSRTMGRTRELSARRRDGTEFSAEISLSSAIETEDGVLVTAAIRDTTERSRADQDLRRLAAIVRDSGDAMIGKTLDGVITSWNPAAERMYGYTSEEIIGKDIGLIADEHRSAEMGVILDKVRDGERVENLDTIRIRKDGTAFPVVITVSPIRDAGGVIIGSSTIARDVTGQRRAFEGCQRLAAIVEGSDDAIYSRGLDGIITSWNPAAERMFGYSGDEIIGRPADDLIIPEGRVSEMEAALAKVSAGEQVEQLETNRVRKNGKAFPASLTISPIRDETGSIVGASVICRDSTELEHAAEYSRSLIEAGLDPLVTISPEGRINDVNQAMVKVTGVPRERLIGTDFSQYATNPAKAREVCRLAYEQGPVTDYPLTLRRHPDGVLTDVLYNVTVYRDLDGEVLGVLAAARDVTKQTQAFDAARGMIESSLDSLVAISPEGMITDANEATIKVTGVGREELIGTAFSDYFTESDKADEIYQRVFADGMAVDYALVIRHRDGRLTDVLYNASVYRDVKGNVLGVFAAARDVTRQMHDQRETARHQARELDRLAELERFQRLTVGRELKMVELKKEVESLRRITGAGAGESDDWR